MRFLILNTDYPEFFDWFYRQHPGLKKRPYEDQVRARAESLFGVADFCSSNLRLLGHEAWEIYANNPVMQGAWAREHGLALPPEGRWEYRLRRGIVPWLSRVRDGRRLHEILIAQIKHYAPDVLLNQALDSIEGRLLKEVKPYVRLMVGQHASPLPEGEDFGCYDLIVSSLPNFVDHFRRIGIPAELHRLAFEPRVLDRLPQATPTTAVSFVGSLTDHHGARVALLEYLCARLDIAIWGPGVERLPPHSAIRRHHRGRAWAIEMYRVLRDSRITLNHHIGVAEQYANNMRLYEATGAGSLLVTDAKANLHEMFEPGREVAVYRTPPECAEMIQYYMAHENEGRAIARAGQQRTLREHTYFQRMQDLTDLVRKRL